MELTVFVGLGALSFIGAMLRIRSHRGKPATLYHAALVSVLLLIGATAVVYGTMEFTDGFYNIGLGLWHALLSMTIGGLEVVALAMRSERVPPGALGRTVARSVAVTTTLLATWIIGFAHQPPIYSLGIDAERNPAVMVHMVVFTGYIVWGLLRILALCVRQLKRDWGRRPVSMVASLMIFAGCAGFIWVNVAVNTALVLGLWVDMPWIYGPTPLYLSIILAGALLLALGDRLYDEVVARYRLRRMNALWDRMMELMPLDLHLDSSKLGTPARLQRAYVEISDAMCMLRVERGTRTGPEGIAELLFWGEVVEDQQAPTVSQALPERRTRREDLEAIHALADAYRRYDREQSAVLRREGDPAKV